ncbi:Dopey, N-terminal-domain-containing protein [Infundibulicybe gibba]|nr:Dopey, N-terminal-domain-containing protein [Infundibulicybe gibba]
MSNNSPQISDAESVGTIVNKGSAWISARTSERAVAHQTVASDPKYKKYAQQVEKCLNSFDNVHEWADCIAFLKQLLKTFQSYMQFKEIPRKLIVAKRLSQCLNPALPTGVHQRALDVYAHILAVLGSEGLKRDLALWSSGLFPFFEYAATSVKPTLLNLYDTHYLPLQAGLRPIMKSFTLALLPGLEEETGEFFEKVLSLLDKLSGTVSPSFFFQNIWLVMLTTPSARGTSINFLVRRLPRLNADEDITEVVGRDIGLMIRAFAAALEDENLLVRRGALDLLLQTMRVDSTAIRKAQTDDRAILMRAATSVVLRRDLSLNRRLYTWLLGPDEKSERQVAYLREHALGLLTDTLKNEMESPSGEYSETRPFKIFISLLDKWEVGAALTEILVYDAFKAIKHLIENPSDGGEDVTMTASTLYEAIEPHTIWKKLIGALFQEIVGDGTQCEAINMVRFILKTFSQDEEIQTIHLPIIFVAIAELLQFQIQHDSIRACSPSIQACLSLQEELLRQIPHTALMQRPDMTDEIQVTTASQGPYQFACTFYKIEPIALVPGLDDPAALPFASAFENGIALSLSCAQGLSENPAGSTHLWAVLSQALLLLDRLVGRLRTTVTLSWNPNQWLALILQTLENKSATFKIVDRIIALVVSMQQISGLQPPLSIDDRPTMYKMVTKLLLYLRPNYSTYHARAVNLIWSLEAATKRAHVEAILAQSMNSPEYRNVYESYEAFGIFWRLTEDNLLPGFRFKIPMMIVLDTLKSDDPCLRRIGETWMRCSLKSYLRVLDPILFELLDPSIRRAPTTTKIRGRELQTFVYERPFDQRYINHLLEMLLSIVRFGGQGFTKSARSSPIRRSHHAGLVQRVESGGLTDPDASYLDAAIVILTRFLLSEPKPSLTATVHPGNLAIQSTAVDLLQVLIARGEIDLTTIEAVEAIVIGKLYFCVHVDRLDLQNKLLHLLHSLISASILHEDVSPPRVAAGRTDDGSMDVPGNSDNEQDPGTRGYSVNALLIQTLMDGISIRTNRPVLQHWLDFVLMAVPQFQPALQTVVTPMNDCICKQLLALLVDLIQSSSVEEQDNDTVSSATDAEFIMLLNGLERLILISLAYTSEPSSAEDETSTTEKSGSETTGLLGYVSNVFSSDNVHHMAEEQLTAKSPGYRSLHDGIRVLYTLWASTKWTAVESTSPKNESLALIFGRARLRCRRVIEHLFRVQSAEVLESLVDCWSRDSPLGPSVVHDPDAAFELVDILIANAHNTVHLVCESISCRTSGSLEKSKKQVINPNLTDLVLFQFLEQYLTRLEGPLAFQVWPRFLHLVKEIIGPKEFKQQNFPMLRCLTILAEKLTQNTVVEDRRVRKELQENFAKLLDTCVTHVGRSADQTSWIRRSARDSSVTNGRDSPIPRNAEAKFDEKLNASTTSLPTDTLRPSASSELANQITAFIASSTLPNLRKFLIESDKVASACNNIIYYIVNPAMKGRTRPLEVDEIVIGILREMSRIPAALKVWRAPVTELLNDTRVFNGTSSAAEKWKPIIRALFDSDKTAFSELLGKVATAPSANIFTNREYEMLLRSLNVRRLSFVLFTADKNHFITQLPTILEKLVDILRNVTAPIVQSEVFLCIRVLLCRLSAHNLTSFWPVLLTELYRIFEQMMGSLPPDGSEDLQLILSASKCLDTLLVLQTEEFQMHQWIFITDTVDAVYRPDGLFPEAMLDLLAEIAGNLPAGASAIHNGSVNSGPSHLAFPSQRPMRRPLLNSLRQIDSVRDLVPFFSNVSVASYESVYGSGGNIDWEAVEQGIMDDMFDGR